MQIVVSCNTCDACTQDDAQATTEKWGLEAGLFKVFTNKQEGGKSKGQQAKELLTRYGSAYLITSISFALVSFTLCYALISSGQCCIHALHYQQQLAHVVFWKACIEAAELNLYAPSCDLVLPRRNLLFPIMMTGHLKLPSCQAGQACCCK